MSLHPQFVSMAALAALLGACTVGPDFRHPINAVPAASLLEGRQAPVGARLTEAPPPDQWWMVFDDTVLAALEARVAAQNLDVQTASTRLQQARAQRRIAGGGRFPTIGGSGSYARTRTNPHGPQAVTHNGSPDFDVFDGGFDASWEVDLWGRVRRTVEAADARLGAAENDRRLALLLIEGELARDYIALRASQAQFDVLRDNLEIARGSVALTRSRFANGVTTRLDVANAEAQVSAIEAGIPTVEAERDTRINALSLLLALPPRALESELGGGKGLPVRPKEIAVGIPSELLLRRPDIRRAEDDLHAATAEIGVARADFYPRISLNGSLFNQTFQLSSFGSWGSRQLSLGPAMTLPLFQGGRVRGMLDLRKAEQQEAAIRYQQVVLGAWHEVDGALIAYTAEQRRRDSLIHAVDENEIALSVAQRRYREGAIDFLNVLSVQKALLDARSEVIRSGAAESINLINLFTALGGGWEGQFRPE